MTTEPERPTTPCDDPGRQFRAAGAGVATTAAAAATIEGPRRGYRRTIGIDVVLLGLSTLWEVAKWLGGDPWRLPSLGCGLSSK